MTDGNTALPRRPDQRVSRRDFGRRLAKAGLLLAVLPLASRQAIGSPSPIYYTWDLYNDPRLFPAYTSRHGQPPVTQTFIDENEALNQLRNGLQVDVAHPCNGQIKRWRDAGVLQPIDTTRLSNWADVYEPLKAIPGAVLDGTQWFIPIDWGITSVVYRTDLVDVAEESLTLLWDERYAGRLSVGQDASDTVTIAGIVAGARDPFAMSDDELATVKELLLKQKPLLRFYWSDWSSLVSPLTSGEIVASTAWPDTVMALKKAGVPIKFMNPREGAISFSCGLVLTRNAAEVDKAYDLIDAILAPEAGKWIIETWGYGHSNRKSFDMIDDDLLADLGMPRDVDQLLSHGHFTREFDRLDLMQTILEEVMGVS